MTEKNDRKKSDSINSDTLSSLAQKTEEFVEKAKEEVPKMKKSVDQKIEGLEDKIREEPLKSVAASFLLGLFIGRMMK
jgi:ElaB/YqjD/DUF883 family membrane-anchored ribosome-binding protein